MKRVFSFLLTTSIFIAMCLPISFAISDLEQPEKNVIYIDGTIYDADGNIILPQSPEVQPRGTLYHIQNKEFIGVTGKKIILYLTQSWAKADNYTFSKSKTLTTSLETNGEAEFTSGVKASRSFTQSVSRTFSVTTSIPADPNRYSKLAHMADYNEYECDLWRYMYTDMEVLSHVFIGHGSVFEPRETYLEVVYQ